MAIYCDDNDHKCNDDGNEDSCFGSDRYFSRIDQEDYEDKIKSIIDCNYA